MRKILFILLTAISSYCQAANTTSNFPIGATVVGYCTLPANLNMAFPDYNPISDSTTSVSIPFTCNPGTTWSFGIAGSSAQFPSRYLNCSIGSIGTLPFNYYSDSNYSSIIPSANYGYYSINGTGTGNEQNIIIYGKIPAGNWSQKGACSNVSNFRTMYIIF
jgi:spore coat protein U-like protein